MLAFKDAPLRDFENLTIEKRHVVRGRKNKNKKNGKLFVEFFPAVEKF